jgi:hypothetical protein
VPLVEHELSTLPEHLRSPPFLVEEEFEDTKGVIRIRISKEIRQHNGQKKKDKRISNDLKNIHIKLKIE